MQPLLQTGSVCEPACGTQRQDMPSVAYQLKCISISQETGGKFNALHVRSTDWAMQYPEWYIEPEDLAPKALRVSRHDAFVSLHR